MSSQNKLNITIQNNNDNFRLVTFCGEEGLSVLPKFELEVASHNTNVNLENVVSQWASLSISHHKVTQYFYGLIDRIEYGPLLVDEQRQYKLTVVTWLNLFAEQTDSRIFQNQTVIDITKLLFKQHNLYDVDFTGIRSHYSAYAYCTQYEETTLDFLRRIWAENGIYFRFEIGVRL